MIPTGQAERQPYIEVLLPAWTGSAVAQSCTRCGALVIDTALHTAWHEET